MSRFLLLLLFFCTLAAGLYAAPAPSPSAQTAGERAYKTAQEGIQQYRQGHFDKAIPILQEAVHLDARLQDAWWFLGLSQYYTRHFAEAEKAFLELTALNTHNINGWAYLADSAARQGRYDDARRYARRILDFDPRSSFAQYVLGCIDYEQGRLDSAATDFDHARMLYDNDAATWFNLAECQYDQHAPNKAAGSIRRAVMLAPRNIKFLFYEGWYAFMADDRTTGSLAFRRLFDEDKHGSTYTLTARAFFSMLSGDLVSARGSVAAALQQDPENIKAMVLQAMLLDKENKRSEALRVLQEANDIDPMDYDVRDTLTHLGVPMPALRPARLASQKPPNGTATPAAPAPGPSATPSTSPAPSTAPAAPAPSPSNRPSNPLPAPPGVSR